MTPPHTTHTRDDGYGVRTWLAGARTGRDGDVYRCMRKIVDRLRQSEGLS